MQTQRIELLASHEAEIEALQQLHTQEIEKLKAKHRGATSDAILDAECAITQALATQRQLEEQVCCDGHCRPDVLTPEGDVKHPARTAY
jgi:hypothetical protein